MFTKRDKQKAPLLKDIFHELFADGEDGPRPLEWEFAAESMLDGDPGWAQEHQRRLVYEALRPETLRKEDFVGIRFYSIDAHLEDILKQTRDRTLCLVKLHYNDVLDPLLAVFLQQMRKEACGRNQKRWYKWMNKALGNLRAACLCPAEADGKETVRNQLMWAHYAASHTGIAVRYRIKPECLRVDDAEGMFCRLDAVRYEDRRIGLQDLSLQDAMLLKSSAWRYENEYRMLYYSVDKAPNLYKVQPVGIEAVYLGLRIAPKHECTVRNFLNGTGIPILKMQYDNEDLMVIKPVM